MTARAPLLPTRRWPRIVLIVIAALLALWLAWYLLQPVVLRNRASADAAAGVQQHRAAFESEVEQDEALLRPVLGEPAGARYGYVCEVVHDDQGWIVSDWRQECSLRSQTWYPATQSVTALEAAIAARPGAEARFGERFTKSPARDCSRLFSVGRDTATVIYRDPACAQPFSDPTTRFAAVDWTTLPAGVPAAGQNYLVVTREQRISNTSLGCAPTPLFCQAPFENPAV